MHLTCLKQTSKQILPHPRFCPSALTCRHNTAILNINTQVEYINPSTAHFNSLNTPTEANNNGYLIQIFWPAGWKHAKSFTGICQFIHACESTMTKSMLICQQSWIAQVKVWSVWPMLFIKYWRLSVHNCNYAHMNRQPLPRNWICFAAN